VAPRPAPEDEPGYLRDLLSAAIQGLIRAVSDFILWKWGGKGLW
jgi:hypothetical protein